MTDPRRGRKRKDRGSISVTKQIHNRLRQRCQSEGMAVSSVVEELINGFLDRHDGEKMRKLRST